MREHGIVVRLLPVSAMPNLRRRYDRHSHRLFVSERLSPPDQLREVAVEACLVRMAASIAAEVDALKLSSDEARRLARFELGRYAAHALMMPYQPFHAAAVRARYDIGILASRFSVSFEQAATRLTTLQRRPPGRALLHAEIDHAGNLCRRAGARGYPEAASAAAARCCGACAFGQPGQIVVDAVEMPDGEAFLCIARTLEGLQCHSRSGRDAPPSWSPATSPSLTRSSYGAALAVARPAASDRPSILLTPVGPACRLCERAGCLARAEPPLTRPLGLDEMAAGLSAFDFR